MARRRLTFDNPLTRDGPQTVAAGPPLGGEAPLARRVRLKAYIRFIARQAFMVRRALVGERDARRYIFTTLREAWWLSHELFQHTQDEAEFVKLANVRNVVWQVQAKRTRMAERDEIQTAQLAARQAQTDKGRKALAIQQTPRQRTKSHALDLARGMQRRDPSLTSKSEIARRLEAEIGVPASTIRDWLKNK